MSDRRHVRKRTRIVVRERERREESLGFVLKREGGSKWEGCVKAEVEGGVR
jgi:hypothetical protein